MKEIKPEPNQEIITLLKYMLELAEKGEIHSLMMTYEGYGHRIGSWSSFYDNFQLLAHLARQQFIANMALGYKPSQ